MEKKGRSDIYFYVFIFGLGIVIFLDFRIRIFAFSIICAVLFILSLNSQIAMSVSHK